MREPGTGNAQQQGGDTEYRADGEYNPGDRGDAPATAGPVDEYRLVPGAGPLSHDREYIDGAK
jgi:hypothetical protein